MSIARSRVAALGTDESTGITITNTSTSNSGVLDILGDNASVGGLWLYLVFTSTVTAGAIQVRVNRANRANGGTEEYVELIYEAIIAPISGTQKIPLGYFQASRYMSFDVYNNATGASATNVSLLAEIEKVS